MTTKELLAKAKAVGGWHVDEYGNIRTKNRKDVVGREACPVIAAIGGDNDTNMLWHNACKRHGVNMNSAKAIVHASDRATSDSKYRKEMESWCK